jgi:hypothetical protein
VTSVSAVNLNIGRLLTDGTDFNVNYAVNLSAIAASLPGRITLNLTGTPSQPAALFHRRERSVLGHATGRKAQSQLEHVGLGDLQPATLLDHLVARYLGSQWITYYRALRPAARLRRSPA